MSDSRPYMGPGLDALAHAMIYQALYDCKHADSDTRLGALEWLDEWGQEFWDALGLPDELFDKAYNVWVPEHLRNMPTRKQRYQAVLGGN